jgi:broad specificity phosphatase PhoE
VFLLFRHAESLWNAAARWQGHADPPLSPRGREQALALSERLAGERVDVLLASDLRRALETAEIVGAPHGLTPRPDRRLRELDVGEWAGLTRPEIERSAAETLARFDAGDPDVRPGEGETRREIRQRVRNAMAEIAAEHDGRRVAVVTHLGVIRALLPGSEPRNASCVFARRDELTSPDGDGSE